MQSSLEPKTPGEGIIMAVPHEKDLDMAYSFLQQHTTRDTGTDHTQYGKLISRATTKADWRIMPLLVFCYFIQGMDKQVLSYTAVMGLPRDLKLKGNDFSNAATSLFVATLVAEVPTIYALNKVPPGKWLALNCVGWGIATGCMAATRNYTGLLVTRVFIGLFEAAVQPSVALIIGQYYRKDKSGIRYTIMGVSMGLTIIVGAVLSFAFQHVHRAELAGWRILCTLLGCITGAFGLLLLRLLPDTPMQAPFLTESQKIALIEHLSANKTGIRSTSFEYKHILELAKDPQIWAFTLLTAVAQISTGFTLSYTPQVVVGFGFAPPVAALLTAPGGLVFIIVSLGAGFLLNTRNPRAIVAVMPCLLATVAGCLLTFSDANNRAALLTGFYLTNCAPVFFVIAYHWASANVASQTKRAAVMSLITAGFAAGALIGPQKFRANEAPRYISAKIILLSTQAGVAALTLGLGAYYWAVNKKRDRIFGKSEILTYDNMSQPDSMVWENLSDRERHTFRYMP